MIQSVMFISVKVFEHNLDCFTHAWKNFAKTIVLLLTMVITILEQFDAFIGKEFLSSVSLAMAV